MAQNLTTTSLRDPAKAKPAIDPFTIIPIKDTQAVLKVGKYVPNKTPPAKVSSNSIKVGVWDLKSHEFAEFTPPEDTESLFNGPPSESVIGADGRKAIPKKHIMPGGKYRAIVKLFLRFAGQSEGSSWAMATGWLIENDLLVTAGHCSYDWSHKYGRLTHVKAYIGYSGKDSVREKSEVQLRMGIRVTSTERWLSKGATDPRGDVALIRLNKAFTGVTPLKYTPTPLSGSNVRIGVVGYPGDLMKKSTKEKGALMYEMFLPTSYTLDGSKSKMLQYRIDTYGGNSGSPLLRKSDMTSIGVHVLGGNPNSASVIAGKYGNSFDALKTAIKLKTSGAEGLGIRWVTVPNIDTSGGKVIPKPYAGAAAGRKTESKFEASDPQAEDGPPATDPEHQQTEADQFKSALKKAMEATTDPLGAIAAYGLHLTSMRVKGLKDQEKASGGDDEADAGEAVDEVEGAEKDDTNDAADEAADETTDEDESGSQEGVDGDETGEDEADIAEAAEAAAPAYEGVVERALLTDAAFTTLVQLGPERCEKLGYLKYMRPYVLKYGRQCSRAGTAIFPHFIAPVFRTTVAKFKMPIEADSEAQTVPVIPVVVEDPTTLDFGPRLDQKKEAIIEAFTQGIAESLDGVNGEFSEIVSRGLRISGRIVADVAEADLNNVFTEALESTTLDTRNENAFEAVLEDTNSSEYFYDALAQRALIGEAMLEAIMNTPVEVQQQEGIFSSIGSAIKTATKSKILGGIASWATLATTGYSVGKMIYDAAKKKNQKKESEDDGGESEAGLDRDSEATQVDGWEAFLT